MNLLDASRLAIMIATPPLILATVRQAPRCWRALTDRMRDRQPAEPQPYGLPIEKLAADLRRLLHLHGALTASARPALCAHRVWAVEAAIGARAIEAATALGVPHPWPDETGLLTRTQLSNLLTDLAAAGLVLPARTCPFTSDGRL
ncbi:hypothetical protein GCM10010168_30620 [Actinoplanes ianthinogenes]|uniref:Uncharacterized protein n=1 Tax=Actinoplanes ianthinogenes TaxID=122358 RepID=A0ABM7LLV0_9ACTN|nr:hypothetical protein [Actinoplanes ianthinogenes]BCJ40204.1 hypothetical protein Aiant_08610 [Actinoplanes ianthinogenes]GGR10954.1 hypothetical protein GCM10010168_30620 [Actinoplanes ianthinogenes]